MGRLAPLYGGLRTTRVLNAVRRVGVVSRSTPRVQLQGRVVWGMWDTYSGKVLVTEN